MIIETQYKQTESGLFIPTALKSHPTCFDFFAGCGGFSLGVIKAGFEVVGAVEFDESASHTYMCNLGSHPIKIHYSDDTFKNKLENYFEKDFQKSMKSKDPSYFDSYQIKSDIIKNYHVSGDGWIKAERIAGKIYPPVKNFFFGDIRNFSGYEMLAAVGLAPGELDLIIGGPPCQGFSRANSKHQKNIDDPRNNLIFQFARMIVEMRPKTFCMEEVPDVLKYVTPQGVPVLDQFCRILDDGNYMTYANSMRALGIVEKELGKKMKYFVKPKINTIDKKPARKQAKKPIKKPNLLFT